MKERNHMKILLPLVAVCGLLSAQAQNENAVRMAAGDTPIYRVTVIGRTAKAINYQHRSGATKIDFEGTSLLAGSRGEAKVEGKQGYIEIEVEFDNLQPASRLGAEYLTYVMWAITPEGRAVNLGEVLLNGTKSKLNVTTQLQVFGLVVTAEPYFAVSQPSDLVVLENVVRPDTKGKIEIIDAKYELLQRGQYSRLANPLELKLDKKMPLELYEARNAVQIARSVGADRYAAETFQKAQKSLAAAEAYQARNAGKKPVTMTARETVQTAEDARAIAVKRQEADALAMERQQSAEREIRAGNAQAAAQSETERVRMNAEAARLHAQSTADRLNRDNARLSNEKDAQALAAQATADRLKQENDAKLAAANSDAERLRLENEAKLAAAGSDADRLRAENAAKLAAATTDAERSRLESEAKLLAAGSEADRLKKLNDFRAVTASAEADRLKAENDARMAAANAESDRLKRENAGISADASRQKSRMEAEKAKLRSQLLAQFNVILQTRDTARGLIVNMSDVLFDTGKFTLRPLAREKLAKVAGIVSGHPGLRLDIEGHTDSVGGDDYNQNLSEQRGSAVRDYLTKEGMAQSSVTSKGFGKTQPVATNDTAPGRQLNRRVELVISGDVIGVEIGTPVALR
jgi:outer membrane protein OmpA-like peptidoglycan-associated protein